MTRTPAKILLTLALLGLANALYLTYQYYVLTHTDLTTLPCDLNALFSCSSVLLSPHAQLLGLPVCSVAIGFYLVLLAVAYRALRVVRPRHHYMALSVLASSGLTLNLVYIHNEYVFLGVLCVLCLVCGAIVATSLATAIYGYSRS
jgi:uncharacterized membrane protein